MLWVGLQCVIVVFPVHTHFLNCLELIVFISFLSAKAGQRIVGKDGAIYEVVVDPLTGKKYKK